MPFTVREFPGIVFKSLKEYESAKEEHQKTEQIEDTSAEQCEDDVGVARVTATVLPAPKALLESRIAALESRITAIIHLIRGLRKETPPERNGEGLSIGTTLWGESKGKRTTLEVIGDGYLCSNGLIYQSLSAAAEGVSGNRRSGWAFWKDINGAPIGEVTGRFKRDAVHAKASREMP
jgi:hypothetical protein